MGQNKHARHIPSSPITIGLVTNDNWLYGVNPDLRSGVNDALEARGANLLVIPGNAPGWPSGFLSQANILYDFIGSENLDGLIVWSGMLAVFSGQEWVQQFCESFHPLPVVSVTLVLDDIPSVYCDNYRGVYDATEHLIQQHGYRTIAFVGGPEGHPEAIARYEGYADALRDNNILLNPALTAHGLFGMEGQEAGKQAVEHMLNIPGITLEAVVTATDIIALGVIEMLQAKGIKIPDDIAVIGFDDLPEAKTTNPSITSVRQSFYKQGWKAADIILDMLKNKPVKPANILAPELMLRRSCGCSTISAMHTVQQPALFDQNPWSIFDVERQVIIGEMNNSLKDFTADVISPTWADELLDAFISDVEGETLQQFSLVLEGFLEQVTEVISDISVWQDILYILRFHLLFNPDTVMILKQAEQIWLQAWMAVDRAIERSHLHSTQEARHNIDLLYEVNQSLIAMDDLDELMNLTAHELIQLGIPKCFIVLYEDGGVSPKNGKLILAIDESGRTDISGLSHYFPLPELVPGKAYQDNNRHCYSLEPLYSGPTQLGFALIEPGPHEWRACSVLRGIISSAVHGTLLMQKNKLTMSKLWGEMQLARKIQTALLPEKPVIPGYFIVPYMNPADEVGGDYYDIINVDDNLDWLVIGDVSGHGVPAGLIMMMVKTAIQTALETNPTMIPSKLIKIINTILVKNIKQLGENKYMTITVIAAHKAGKFIFSGLHQDILVYRQKTQSIEIIETSGMWIGIMNDIDSITDTNTFSLDVGDALLLYTDGIVEAYKADEQREKMFGLKRLKSAFFEQVHKRSANDIKTGILQKLHGYICDDDVTFVFLRRET